MELGEIPPNVKVERLPSKLFYSNGVFRIISGPLQYTFSEFPTAVPSGCSIQGKLDRGKELAIRADTAQLKERAAVRTNWIMMKELELKQRQRQQKKTMEKLQRLQAAITAKNALRRA